MLNTSDTPDLLGQLEESLRQRSIVNRAPFKPGDRVRHRVKPSWVGTVVSHDGGEDYTVHWDCRDHPYGARNLMPE